MNHEAQLDSWKDAVRRSEGGAAHPAGDIRLPVRRQLGHRALLLAQMSTPAGDPSTIVDTGSITLGWG